MTMPWLRFAATNYPVGSQVRLLCFAHAGGGAASFVRWMDLFTPGITVGRVQLPGREDLAAQPPLDKVEDVVSALLPQVEQVCAPIALYGHSMGALLAYELARALRAQHIPVEHLFISGRRAPQLPASRKPIYLLPDDEFAAALATSGGGADFVAGPPAYLRYAVPLTKADLTLCEEYIYWPRAKLDCPITVFHGVDDIVTDYEEVEAWREQTGASFDIHLFAGDHFFHQVHRSAIAAHISKVLGTRAAD